MSDTGYADPGFDDFDTIVDPDESQEIAERQRFDVAPREHDEHESFPLAELLPVDAAPATKTWTFDHAPLDQGTEGACVGFACAHELIADPFPYPLIGNENGFAIYNEAKKHDRYTGENYSGTDLDAGLDVLLRLHLIGRYHWGRTVDDARLALSTVGPVTVAIPWWSGMDRPDAAGFVVPGGFVRGWHAVTFTGNNEEGSYIRGPNSWGTRFAKGGFFNVRHEHFAQLLAGDGGARGLLAVVDTRF